MKIYVDELPKSCSKCPIKYFKFNEWDCEFEDYCPYTKDKVEYCATNRSNKCPLQSLADHDNQVRKEVCEQVKTELLDFSHEYWRVFQAKWKTIYD